MLKCTEEDVSTSSNDDTLRRIQFVMKAVKEYGDERKRMLTNSIAAEVKHGGAESKLKQEVKDLTGKLTAAEEKSKELEAQLRITESERDAVRSKARAQSVAMPAKKGLDDLRRAEGVGITEGGKDK